jgi:anti-sigma B factor antagonist
MLDISPVGQVLHLVGELDLHAEPALRAMLAQEIQRTEPEGVAHDIVIDLAGVTFMDSTGLNVILWAGRELGAGRSIRLRNAGRVIRRLLDMTGVLGIGNVFLEETAPSSKGTPAG